MKLIQLFVRYCHEDVIKNAVTSPYVFEGSTNKIDNFYTKNAFGMLLSPNCSVFNFVQHIVRVFKIPDNKYSKTLTK